MLMRIGRYAIDDSIESDRIEGKTWLLVGNGRYAALTIRQLVSHHPARILIHTRASTTAELEARAEQVLSCLYSSSVRRPYQVDANKSVKTTVSVFEGEDIDIEIRTADYLKNRSNTVEPTIGQADIISIHLSGDDSDLDGIIDNAFFSQTKKQSIFINAARAKLVNEEHLLNMFKNGHLRGVAVDVLSRDAEDVKESDLSVLWSAIVSDPRSHLSTILQEYPNLLVTPHIGGDTLPDRTRIGITRMNEFLDLIGIPLYQ
jgi:lactate dehydrogenase-like 2-hydroxyacid dehydrogenase